MKIALSLNGRYVCAESDDAGTVHADRSQLGSWEQWTVERQDNGSIALKSAHGKYLAAEDAGGGDVHANREHASIWEQFTPTGNLDDGARVAFKTFDGQHFLNVPRAGEVRRLGAEAEVEARSTVPIVFVVTVLEADVQSTGGVTARNHDLWNADGTRHTVIGSTELLLPVTFDRDGADACRPVLEERKAIGFNNLRFLFQKDIRNKGERWMLPLDKIAPLLDLCCDEYGFIVQGTILADCQVVNPDERAQQQRVADVRRVTTGRRKLWEQLGNEAFKNGFTPAHFSKPSDRLAINASGLEGRGAERWDVFTFSAERDPVRKAIMEYGPIEFIYGNGEWGGIPAYVDESAKPGDPNVRGQYNDPRVYERMGAQARSGVGGRLHHFAGTGNQDPTVPLSRLFNALEKECAYAFVAGLRG